jgi:uncharacterized protein YlxW (UPF0749 family)
VGVGCGLKEEQQQEKEGVQNLNIKIQNFKTKIQDVKDERQQEKEKEGMNTPLESPIAETKP